jgi:outer membrane protein assembly factor BamB
MFGIGGQASAAIPAWTTYHRDAARSGVDPDSSSPVPPTQLWQTTTPLDGQIYGQPLVYGSRVYVATENDSVYALDAATGAIIWHRQMGIPVPDQQNAGCGDIGDVGITSTPVIDPATGRIYVVGDTWDGSDPASIHHLLVGYNLADGSLAGAPRVVDGPGSQPAYQLQRPALALDAGNVIIGYGGNAGDCGPYNGWLVAAPENGGPLTSFRVELQDRQGAIWASGNGPPVDAAGDVWASTGNGDPSAYDYQESVLKLDSNLQLLDHWAPVNWSSLDSGDVDLGSSMPLLLPGGLVFEIGKEGVGYLLRSASLGGTGAAPAFEAQVCKGSWGGGVYFDGVIYVACSGGLRALMLNTSVPSFAPTSDFSPDSPAAGPPIVAAGMVWSVDWHTGELFALDPVTGATRFSADLGSVDHFVSPSAAGGRLFVGAGDRVTAFTIAQPPPPSPTATALSSSAKSPSTGARVTFTATVSPVPDAGTVTFTNGGSAMKGCGAVAPSEGVARCTVSFRSPGPHRIAAAYSGDPYYAASRSTRTQNVVAPPSLSRVSWQVSPRHVTLRLTLSEPAIVVVVITGHDVKRTLRLRGVHGRNSFTVRGLPKRSYTGTVQATDSAGLRSAIRRLQFVIN